MPHKEHNEKKKEETVRSAKGFKSLADLFKSKNLNSK